MGFFDKWPYGNFHNLNLDWIVESLRTVADKVENIQQTITQTIAEYINSGGVETTIKELVEEEVGSELDTINREISTLNTTTSNNSLNIETLQNNFSGLNIANLYNGKFLFVGDSWAAGTSSTLPDESKTIPYVVSQIFKCTYDKAALGGAGFVQTSGGKTIQNVLDDFIGDHPNPEYKAIFVICGINDLRGGQDVKEVLAAMKNVITTLLNWAGRVPIYFCLNAPSKLTIANYQWIEAIRTSMFVTANTGVYTFIPDFTYALYANIANLYERESVNPGYGGVHPTANGYYKLSHIIAAHVLGGGGSVMEYMADMSWLKTTDLSNRGVWFYQAPMVFCNYMVGNNTDLSTGIHYFANHGGAIDPYTLTGAAFSNGGGRYMGQISATTDNMYLDVQVRAQSGQYPTYRGVSALFLGYVPQ